jgi:hypothetical protein
MADRRQSGNLIVDRRRASRLPLRFELEYSFAGASFEATARNLTIHGIFVETEEPYPKSGSVELSLKLPDDDGASAKVMGNVTRAARRRDEVAGFAADFIALDDDTARRIGSILKRAGLAARSDAVPE